MILIAYDGSDDAKAAITQAGKLFPGQPATIVTGWTHFIDTMARAGSRGAMIVDYDAVDEAAKTTAAEHAREGAVLASDVGLSDVHSVTVDVVSTLADALLAEAETLDAQAIVLGSRGLGTVKAFLLGSVSSAVLHHADRPVVIVPSPEVAAHRAEHLR